MVHGQSGSLFSGPTIDIGPEPILEGITAQFGWDCRLFVGLVNNPGSVAVTFSMQDGAGFYLVSPREVAPGIDISWNFGPAGLYCPGGVQWTASATGLTGRFTIAKA